MYVYVSIWCVSVVRVHISDCFLYEFNIALLVISHDLTVY